MNTKEALKASLDMGLFLLNTYLSDLTDADLLLRPGPGCNHLAWQIGHLIGSEVWIVNDLLPGQGGELPPGFAEKHSKTTTHIDDASQFCSKQEYLELYEKVRVATKAALDTLSDSDLDKPGPERMRKVFPTVGHMFTLIGNHPTMHAGQIAVVRRQLGKPVLI